MINTYIIYDSIIYNIFVSLAEFWSLLGSVNIGTALGFSLDFSLRDLILGVLFLFVICNALASLFGSDFEE